LGALPTSTTWSMPDHFMCAPRPMLPLAEAAAPVRGTRALAITLELPGTAVPTRGPAPSTTGLPGSKGSVPGRERSRKRRLFTPNPPR